MKKKFFTLFSATLATLALALLSSCSGITSPSEPEAATVHQAEGLSLRGTFSMAEATAEPSLKTSTPSSSRRNAIPDIGDLKYSVKAYRPSDGATKWADVNQSQKSYVFNNTLSAGTWQITAYANQEGNGTPIMQSQTVTATLSKSRPDTSANLALAPSTEGSGEIALTVSWANGTGIGWVKYRCPAFSTGENQGPGSENSFALSADSVAAGIYPITISFYKSMESTIPLYSCTEYIAVYPELNTNQWTKSTAPHISSSGQFLVTADCVKTFVYRSVYLSSSGDDDTANGTSERPYKTAGAAMARLTELASTSIHSISEATPWELHVVGTIKASSIAANSKAFIDVPSSIGFLKIVGEGSGATLDANEKGRVLYVANGANVTIKDITLQKGKLTENGGGGVYVSSGGTFTMESGTITSCTSSSSSGGGIYAEGTVKITDGTISNNSANLYGGGLYVLSSGKVSITGGTITGNSASNNANNILIGNCNSASSFPDGNDSFYDDTSTTNANGKADAISVFSGKQFARFNKPASNGGTSNLAQIADDFYFGENAGTIYLGNTTDTTGKTWVIGEQIQPKGVLTIACPSTASTVKATIKPASSFSNYQIINHNKNNDITLKKIILDGNNSVRCISNSSGSLTMQSCTLTKGGGYTTGAGLYISGGSASVDTNSSITACDNSSITSSQGGGVYISGASTRLTLEGTISGCKSKNGGGIYLNNGSVTLNGNALIGQNVSGSNCPTSIDDGSNKATALGAGVYVQAGTFTMKGSSKISYNYASSSSGGLYIEGGTAYIGTESDSSPSVCNNGSDAGTGGIYIVGSGKVYLFGSVKANSSYDISVTNMLYMQNNATAQKISTQIGSAFIYAKDLTATRAATITPLNSSNSPTYDTSKQIVYQLGSSNLAAACAKFAIADDAEGRKWTVDTNGYLSRVSNLLQSSSKMVITDPTEQYIITSSTSGQIDINQNVATTPSLPYEITLRNLTRNAGNWESALILYNDDVNTPLSVKINLEGTNSLIGHNHGGIKLWAETTSTKTINLEFTTESSATLTFDATYSSTPSLDIRNVINANLSISSGCSFTGTIGGTSYTNSTAFFNAAKTTTQSCTFTITRP
ncbi:MAG: hypothetical protein IJM03_07185 [Treponema sp.]|nr:hypothetical protein [Treponema sp.]